MEITKLIKEDTIEINLNDSNEFDDIESSVSLSYEEGLLWSITIYVNEQRRGQHISSLLLSHLMNEFKIYLLKKYKQNIPPLSMIRIGIDTDASDGYWESLGFYTGRYSVDGDRYKSHMADGMESETTAQKLHNIIMEKN